MLEVQHLSIAFKDFYAVKNISFTINRGEIFGLLGANGAGKTTTIRVLCGLIDPTEGNIFYQNENMTHRIEQLKGKIGHMSQKFTLYDDLTIYENFQFVAALRKVPSRQLKNRIDELKEIIGLQTGLNSLVKDLPGGVKQQVALMSALIHDPEILFLDEPTSGVSPLARERFWNLIQNLILKGKTVLVTTHYMDEAEMCHRMALMRAGEIIALDTPSSLKKKTFPHGVFELEWKGEESREDPQLKEMLKNPPQGLFISPYGTRYHLFVHNLVVWSEQKIKWEKYFWVRPVQPSLEDVFIELVEGVNR